ncbi:hypothetical protein BKA63DRAFT_503090 [Paraphoma chrysanthemicola]|nr:hypothetical protein BKA63DRAFT_503090 [Paraphoma chrysanthemicola]
MSCLLAFVCIVLYCSMCIDAPASNWIALTLSPSQRSRRGLAYQYHFRLPFTYISLPIFHCRQPSSVLGPHLKHLAHTGPFPFAKIIWTSNFCQSYETTRMVIKAGQLMASAPGKDRTVISDGKWLRVVWTDGDGDGESSAHLIERSHGTVKGHPTWKVFCGQVADFLERGKEEPPRYVFLDDQACHLVWSSQKYTKHEMNLFWPFDFDSSGKIRVGRMNKGRPAYVDASHSRYATALLRGKNKIFEFSGSPDWMPELLKEEASVGSDVKLEKDDNTLQPQVKITTSSRDTVTNTAQTPAIASSALTPTSTNTPSILPSNTDWGVGNGRIPFTRSEPTRYISGPVDGSLKPLGMAQKAMQGSPYFEVPAAAFRSRPRPRDGDLGGSLGIAPKRKMADDTEDRTKEKGKENLAKGKKRKVLNSPVSKRTGGGFIRSLAPASADAGVGGSVAKKVKVEGSDDDLMLSANDFAK